MAHAESLTQNNGGSPRGFFARARAALGVGVSVLFGREVRGYTIPAGLSTWLGLGAVTKAGPRVDAESSLGVSSVYACTGIISGAIARLPLKLYQKTADGREEVTDHPASALITTSPDGIRTAFAWRQMMEATVLLNGNAYALIERDAYHDPVALRWVNASQMECRVNLDGQPFYFYRGKLIPNDEVFHHREMSLDGIRGISPVTAMREQIAMAIATQEHGARHFSNGASPGMVMTMPLATTEAQMVRARDEINKNHGGVANSGKPFLAYGGSTVTTVSLSNVDSQFLESRKFDVEEIARAYRVPLVMLQSTEKSTSWGTGIEQLSRIFISNCLADRMERWEQELDLSLLTVKERAAGYYFKFNLRALLSGSNADRAAFYTAMRTMGAMSVNEIREAEDMNDLPDHIGDNYLLPMNGSASAAAQAGGKPLPVAAGAES